MELRQMRYFVRAVEAGSLTRAAAELGVVTSALSQQISRLEGELSTRLLQRSATGVQATEAGLAFLRQAQLALRHADEAASAAREARLAGQVSVGLPSSSAAVLAMPFLDAMRERYPDVRLHLVEALSGNLGTLLNARQLDLALLFDIGPARRWSIQPLLDEQLFVMGKPGMAGLPRGPRTRIAALNHLPLALPTGAHGLRAVVNHAFAQARCEPRVVLEADGLAMLMDAVRAGWVATIQPWSASARFAPDELSLIPISDRGAHRSHVLASLSDDELSPAALAARVTLRSVAVGLVNVGRWPGARLVPVHTNRNDTDPSGP
jgi:LysR family transcriptional regulator, regulatory protein for tcuABC